MADKKPKKKFKLPPGEDFVACTQWQGALILVTTSMVFVVEPGNVLREIQIIDVEDVLPE